MTALEHPGPWRAYGNVRTEVTGPAVEEFVSEIRRIRDEKAPYYELEQSKRSLVARFALSLERPQRLLGYAITRRTYGLPPDYWDEYPARVMAVTAEEVGRVASKYLDPDAMQIVVVGDAARVRAVLESYGPIEAYDGQGRRVAGDP